MPGKKKNKRPMGQPKPVAPPNPFESIPKRRKFEVVGRRDQKGSTSTNVVQARERGVQKRQETMAPEFFNERAGKVGGFFDRRFGERDQNMSSDDRAVERFKMERVVCFPSFHPFCTPHAALL